jgi:hypothetical protein
MYHGLKQLKNRTCLGGITGKGKNLVFNGFNSERAARIAKSAGLQTL